MTSTRSSHAARCASVLVATTLALMALWSVAVPPPEWPIGGDDGSVARLSFDPTALLTHGARIAASVLLGYLAVAASLNLLVGLCSGRRRLPSPVTRAAARAPGWLRAASAGLVAGSTLLAPAVATAAPLKDDPSGDAVTMEVVAPEAVGTGSSGDRAHRSVLPWTLPGVSVSVDEVSVDGESMDAESVARRRTSLTAAEPESGPDSVPTTSALPAPAPLPDPPRLESVPTEEPPKLIPPLTLQRTPDGRVVEVPPATESPASTPSQHTVAPGEHFWAIAERVIADQQLDVPIADYWRLLVEANRSRLTDPTNPSLLFPGQVLVLP